MLYVNIYLSISLLILLKIMSENYYKTLGVDEKASKEEIKKAFRTLSMKWHPDKNLGNKEESVSMFQKINEAYETLGNEEKREQYDMMNQNPFMRGHNNNNNSMDAHMEDFLNNIFGSGMFPGMPGMPPGMRSHPSNPFPGIHIFHGGPQMMNSLIESGIISMDDKSNTQESEHSNTPQQTDTQTDKIPQIDHQNAPQSGNGRH
jgi:hypothetical protein